MLSRTPRDPQGPQRVLAKGLWVNHPTAVIASQGEKQKSLLAAGYDNMGLGETQTVEATGQDQDLGQLPET